MSKRQFSMSEYWNKRAKDFEPLLTFKGSTKSDWAAWRAEALPKFSSLLGDYPERVAPEAEIEYSIERDGLILERVVFDTEEDMSLPCLVLRPKDMKPDGSGAAIICSHGHGPFGKDPVAGLDSTPSLRNNIKQHNYNYAEQMARAGFMTLSPDLRVFGERRDGPDPFPGRDPCNVNFIKGAILGVYTLTLNIWDIKCCIDYLETRAEIGPGRIGMMGLSQGGTMTTFSAAADERIKAADIIGYVNSWKGFGIGDGNFCGSQIVPEIMRDFDVPDIAGLIAPRPLLIEMGEKDDCFKFEALMDGYEKVKRIYGAAGAGEKLWKDVGPGGHAFVGAKAAEFFKKYL